MDARARRQQAGAPSISLQRINALTADTSDLREVQNGSFRQCHICLSGRNLPILQDMTGMLVASSGRRGDV
jgi:hypothetical protein